MTASDSPDCDQVKQAQSLCCPATAPAIYYYEKLGVGGDYVFQQGLKFEKGVISFAVDKNDMVLGECRSGRSNVIHFFVLENGAWREVRTLDEPTFDQSFGEDVALSRNHVLISSKKNIYFNP
jgi:hypothetical protein